MGRPPDIPPGIEALILAAGICIEEGYRPLYAIQDYYENKDLEGIFHYPIEVSQLTDDRFGGFLDSFYEAGCCRQIFSEMSAKAFFQYGIKINNINYDTTSKVMWGEYEQTNRSLGTGKVSHISIDFGHSKQKRNDKRQIKIGLGTTNGVVTDAKVLSGNMDDKTYNKENIEDVDRLLTTMKVDRNQFYYIADSALFTEENIARTKEHNIKFITRIPDNIKVAKRLIKTPLPEDAQVVLLENARGEQVLYHLKEKQTVYRGHPCKLAVIYAKALEKTKIKTCQKRVKKERKDIESKKKKYGKRTFKCKKDAQKEGLLLKKTFSKLKYHMIDIVIEKKEKRRPGKPSKNPEKNKKIAEYQLKIEIHQDEIRIVDYIRQQCTFILCSNDLEITGNLHSEPF